MKSNERDPAPALSRGIAVMQALQHAASGLSLDELAAAVRAPKSSLLRILRSLELSDWIQRTADKRYQSRVIIQDATVITSRSWNEQLHECLRELSRRLLLTVEWYEPEGKALVIRWRQEHAQGSVQVKAQLGFTRNAIGEIDAVARQLIAHGEVEAGQHAWRYRNGERRRLTARQRLGLSQDSALVTHDTEYNSNGVRRLAGAILDAQGRLIVVALAEAFTPDADKRQAERLTALTETVNQLQAIQEKNDG